jgi:hypothetical protein
VGTGKDEGTALGGLDDGAAAAVAGDAHDRGPGILGRGLKGGHGEHKQGGEKAQTTHEGTLEMEPGDVVVLAGDDDGPRRSVI